MSLRVIGRNGEPWGRHAGGTVGALWCTGGMAFVHGHARDSGWVVAHVRAPVEAEDGQLPLPEPDDDQPPPVGGDGAADCAADS